MGCYRCDSGCEICNNVKSCARCKQGKYLVNDTTIQLESQCVVQCAAGTYADIITRSCKSCGPLSTSLPGSIGKSKCFCSAGAVGTFERTTGM